MGQSDTPVQIRRPSAGYFLRHTKGQGCSVEDMEQAEPGSAREEWLAWMYDRERAERWLLRHATPVTPSDDFHREATNYKGQWTQTPLPGDVQIPLENGLVVNIAAETRWWWEQHGLILWFFLDYGRYSLYQPPASQAMPDYVAAHRENSWWVTTYPSTDAPKWVDISTHWRKGSERGVWMPNIIESLRLSSDKTWHRPSAQFLLTYGLPVYSGDGNTWLPKELLRVLCWLERYEEWWKHHSGNLAPMLSAAMQNMRAADADHQVAAKKIEAQLPLFPDGHIFAQDEKFDSRIHFLLTGSRRLQAAEAVKGVFVGRDVGDPLPNDPPWLHNLYAALHHVQTQLKQGQKEVPSTTVNTSNNVSTSIAVESTAFDTLNASGPYAQVLGYWPVHTFVEGIYRFAERTSILRPLTRPPHVYTHGKNVVSYGGPVSDILNEDESAAAYTAALKLTSGTAKAFVLALSRWCAEANRANPRNYVTVSVNDYCAACGYHKHKNGGYRQPQKRKASQDFMALNKVYGRHKVPDHIVRAREKKGHQNEARYVEGQAMIVAVESTDANGLNPVSFRVAPGAWADDYLEDNPACVAVVLERILSIDASTRTGELAYRIGLYISLNWRTKIINNNAKQGHIVGELLQVLGIDPASITHREERRRLREYLEGGDTVGALDLLQQADVMGTRDDDGALIDGWRYGNPEADDPASSSNWDNWLKWKILLPPPQVVVDYYQGTRLKRHEAIKQEQAGKRRRERAVVAAETRHKTRGKEA